MYIKDPILKSVSDCCWKVWKTIGPGFDESYYKKALQIELEKIDITCQREVFLPLYYENIRVDKKYLDVLVDGWLIVEAKAVSRLTPSHYSQTNAYLKAFGHDYGVLVNFGSSPMQFKIVYKNRGLT